MAAKRAIPLLEAALPLAGRISHMYSFTLHLYKNKLYNACLTSCGGVGELSPRFQPGEVRRDALLTSERRDTLG